MSKRRAVGEWVWVRAGAGFCGESWRLQVELTQNLDHPCFLCDDEDCDEWDGLTAPDPQANGVRYDLYHLCECEMFDEQQERSDA